MKIDIAIENRLAGEIFVDWIKQGENTLVLRISQRGNPDALPPKENVAVRKGETEIVCECETFSAIRAVLFTNPR